MAEGIFG